MRVLTCYVKKAGMAQAFEVITDVEPKINPASFGSHAVKAYFFTPTDKRLKYLIYREPNPDGFLGATINTPLEK